MLHSLLSKKINDIHIDLHNHDYIVSFYELLMQDNKFSRQKANMFVQYYTVKVVQWHLI